eukprot:m.249323 g.249323  ORF g.249323 m.249323 type:complete len:263 (-) comp16140_c1_seq19:84-872(-)
MGNIILPACFPEAAAAQEEVEALRKEVERLRDQAVVDAPSPQPVGTPSYAAMASYPSATTSPRSSKRGSMKWASAGSYSSPTPGSRGVQEVLFFPDPAMPCRYKNNCKRYNCEYAHEETNLTKLIAKIDAAHSTLDICVFTITCNELANAVKNAVKRGVKVRLITDDDQASSRGSDIQDLANNGVEARHDQNDAHMHNKFAIIDNNLLINGSFNWTRAAVLDNRENILITGDSFFVSSFTQEFNKLWAAFSGAGNVIHVTNI